MNTLFILTVLCLLVAGSEWLVRHTWMRHLGTALLVILLTAIIANLGLLPTGSTEQAPVAAYEGIFAYVAPISLFWLLLRVNLRAIVRVGLPLLLLFLSGSLGTMAGVIFGLWLTDGPNSIGPLFTALGGMYTGTYIGGSINFNAVALHYNVVREGILYGGAVAADNIVTMIWMAVTLSLPRILAPFWPVRSREQDAPEVSDALIDQDTEHIHPMDLGMTLALGLGSMWLSMQATAWLSSIGWNIPLVLIISIIALIIAQLPVAQKIRGGQLLGLFSVYLFLAVIGAFCDVRALGGLGHLGFVLLGIALLICLFNGIIVFALARILKLDLDMAAVASQANIGGATSALALARSRGRQDLVLPAVLLGALGNAIGTFAGFWMAEQVLPALF